MEDVADVIVLDSNLEYLQDTDRELKKKGITALLVQNNAFALKMLGLGHPVPSYCSVCFEIFDNTDAQNKHDCLLKGRLLSAPNFQRRCPECDEDGLTDSELVKHVSQVHGFGEYDCARCGMRNMTKTEFREHSKIHKEEDKEAAARQKKNILEEEIHNLEGEIQNLKLPRKPTLILTSETIKSEQVGDAALLPMLRERGSVVVLTQDLKIEEKEFEDVVDVIHLPLEDPDVTKIKIYMEM